MNARKMGTVFVVDDEPSVRRVCMAWLETAGYTVECFASGAEFLRRMPHDGVGCVVLDLVMSPLDGNAVHEELKKSGSTMPVIFLSGKANVPSSVKAMKRGAVDFIEKSTEMQTVVKAIAQAVQRHRNELNRVTNLQAVRDRIRKLTPREHEVMTYMIAGMLVKQVACKLKIAERTVKFHWGHVMEKLGTQSLAEVTRICDRLEIQPAMWRRGARWHSARQSGSGL